MLDALREFTAAEVLCPHPEERARSVIFVRDPAGGPSMGLCTGCKRAMEDLIERRASRLEVLEVFESLGYQPEDAERFFSDMQEAA